MTLGEVEAIAEAKVLAVQKKYRRWSTYKTRKMPRVLVETGPVYNVYTSRPAEARRAARAARENLIGREPPAA